MAAFTPPFVKKPATSKLKAVVAAKTAAKPTPKAAPTKAAAVRSGGSPKALPGRVIPIKPLTSWSFSRYNDWKTCPLKCKLKHIDKIKEPPSEAMNRGNRVHSEAENYIKGTVPKLSADLQPMKPELDRLKKMYKAKKLPMIVEDNWAFKADWSETTWNDWVGCWVRIKLDCAHYAEKDLMVVTDWKTGKANQYKTAEYMEQLDLYGLSALLMAANPESVRVRVRIGWTDSGTFFPAEGDPQVEYTIADLPRLKKEWNNRVKPMMADTKFAPKANGLCGWCFFGSAGKAKGGPGLCKF